MAINSLRDGFVRICFDPSQNVLGTKCRVVLEGQYYDPDDGCDIVADELIKVTSTRDIDCQFGAGSVLAESLKAAFDCCGDDAIEIFALPREDAATGIAAVYEMTVTGSATSAGRIDIYWGDARYNISVRITSGMDVTAIAAAIAAAVPSNFPYTASAAVGVITFTARNAGTVGNFLVPQVNWHGRNDYMPQGVSIAVTQDTVGANDPDPVDYSAALGECCVCCLAVLFGDTTIQDAAIAYLDDAWSCDKPQCFGQGYTYNAGSLGEVLSTDTNSATMVRRARNASSVTGFPWLDVAAYATRSCCLTVDNPELSIEGEFGILDCIMFPESCASEWTFDEREQLSEAGFVTTVAVSGGQGALTSPEIVDDITNNRYDNEGRENLTFRAVSSRRLSAYTADRVAQELQSFQGLGYFTRDTMIKPGTRGTNAKIIEGHVRAWAKQNVGVLFSEFEDINKDIGITDDFEVAAACQGIPGKLYLNMIYRPPVRIQQIQVNAVPKLLSNC